MSRVVRKETLHIHVSIGRKLDLMNFFIKTPKITPYIQQFILKYGSYNNICQDICDLILGTYVKIELINPLTKCTLLVIGQFQDVFNTSKNNSNLVLKPCKFIQETSEEELFIRVGQIPDRQLSIKVSTAARQILSIKVSTAA